MIYLIIILGVFHFAVGGRECPEEFRQFSSKHSYCLPENKKCNIIKRGINPNDKSKILDTHNEYRNKVASGLEDAAGGLPQASDMLMLVWDNTLAAIAQKWAEQCDFNHDCNECRQVRDFPVGQNLYISMSTCNNDKCKKQSERPDWPAAIKSWNSEVEYYNKNDLESYVFYSGTGHMTQDIWAKTWRVGCGFVAYNDRRSINRYYVCNYGPSGNIINSPVYVPGRPCSDCPSNSCCGTNCRGKNSYPALCQLTNPKQSLQYKDTTKHMLDCSDMAHCDVKSGDGVNSWKTESTLSGNIVRIVLRGGQSATLKFKKKLESKQSAFCIILMYRYGPKIDGEDLESEFTLTLKVDRSGDRDVEIPKAQGHKGFQKYSFQFSQDLAKFKFALKFEAFHGAFPQFLEISSVLVDDGECTK